MPFFSAYNNLNESENEISYKIKIKYKEFELFK